MQSENEISPQQEVSQIDMPSKPPERRKLRKLFIICIGLLSIFVIAGIGIMIFSPQKDIKKSFSLDNPEILKLAEKLPIPKITMVPITLAPTVQNQVSVEQSSVKTKPQSWNIYKNTTFNFSMEYPSDLKALEKSHGMGVADISFKSPTNSYTQGAADYQILIYPKIIGGLIGQDFDKLYALVSPSTQRMTSESSVPQQFTKISNMTISGLRAFNFRTTSDPPDPYAEAEVGVYIEIEGGTLIISTKESNAAILDQMISTFKYSK